MRTELKLTTHPLTPSRRRDFETLFGKNGACAGCWCMWWRLAATKWRAQKGEGNRKAMRSLISDGQTPGLLAYADGQPVAWCAVAPRASYVRLASSRVLKPVDDHPVWSVTASMSRAATVGGASRFNCSRLRQNLRANVGRRYSKVIR